MMRKQLPGLVLIACILSSGSTLAGDPDREDLVIGDAAPEFSELVATGGKTYSTADFQDAEILVIAFTCNHCPYAVDYEDRLVALHDKWKDIDSVRLIAINSNFGRDESLEKMNERATSKKFLFPYLKDETQDVARSMSAVYTPEFFVLDRDRKLVYKGALDDSTDADKVTKKHVEDAVDAVLSGKPVPVKEVGARGCTIRFKRRRR